MFVNFLSRYQSRLVKMSAMNAGWRPLAGLVVSTIFAVSLGAASARANIITTFNLVGVGFLDGGKANGSFTLDLTPNPIAPLFVSADVTTTSGSQFAGSHYTTGSVFEILGDTPLFGAAITINAWDVELDNLSTHSSIVFTLAESLTSSGLAFPTPTTSFEVFPTSSYPGEFFPSGFRIFVTGGALEPVSSSPPPSSVPEPGTLAIFGMNLVFIGSFLALRRVRRYWPAAV